jgi:anti-sigma B factor antagonist
MDLIERILSDVVVLQPREHVTVDNEADLKEAVGRHLRAGRVRLVLDLANVAYIDSCGLGTIAQTHLNTQRAGGWLKLQNVTGRNLQLLSVTRLLGVIGEYDAGDTRQVHEESCVHTSPFPVLGSCSRSRPEPN